jgi:hypothetical protein
MSKQDLGTALYRRVALNARKAPLPPAGIAPREACTLRDVWLRAWSGAEAYKARAEEVSRLRQEKLTATIYSDAQGEVPARTWRQDVEEWARDVERKIEVTK